MKFWVGTIDFQGNTAVKVDLLYLRGGGILEIFKAVWKKI